MQIVTFAVNSILTVRNAFRMAATGVEAVHYVRIGMAILLVAQIVPFNMILFVIPVAPRRTFLGEDTNRY